MNEFIHQMAKDFLNYYVCIYRDNMGKVSANLV